MSKKDSVAMIPKYRFPEFLNCLNWKKEELNKLGKVIPGLTYSPQDIREKGLLVLRSSNIKDNIIDLKDTVYVRTDVKGYTLTEEKDILICVRNGSKSLIGKNALVPKGMPLCTNGAFMIVFRANNPCFVFQLFQSEQFNKQVKADLGATINSINSKQLKKYIFTIPQERKEQQKIADCLSSIDDLISAEEKKLLLLNDYKKGWMQKLFPAEGKTVPEWRFTEFMNSGDWEENSLKKVLIKNSMKNKNQKYSLIESISNKFGFVRQDKYFENRRVASKNTSNYYVIKKGYFAYNPSRIDVGSLAYKYDDRTSIISPLYVSFKANNDVIDDIFLWMFFNSISFTKQMIFEGGVRNTLNYENLIQIKIFLPNLPEQQKIAGFLSGIDDLINKQTDKIKILKQHKKALTQGLFPAVEEVL
jgi:restriction modification system DNA specificity domain protein